MAIPLAPEDPWIETMPELLYLYLGIRDIMIGHMRLICACHFIRRISSLLLVLCIIHAPGGVLLFLLRSGRRDAVAGVAVPPFLDEATRGTGEPLLGEPREGGAVASNV